jgi:hypothetical protein
VGHRRRDQEMTIGTVRSVLICTTQILEEWGKGGWDGQACSMCGREWNALEPKGAGNMVVTWSFDHSDADQYWLAPSPPPQPPVVVVAAAAVVVVVVKECLWMPLKAYREKDNGFQPFYAGGKFLGTHWVGCWVGPRDGLDVVEKRKNLLGLSGIKTSNCSVIIIIIIIILRLKLTWKVYKIQSVPRSKHTPSQL